jgi:hypothetical protein
MTNPNRANQTVGGTSDLTQPAGRPASRRQRSPQRPASRGFGLACQTTGNPIDYEVPTDAETVRQLWSRQLRLICRHCRKVHRFSFREAFLASAVAIEVGPALAVSGPSRRPKRRPRRTQR